MTLVTIVLVVWVASTATARALAPAGRLPASPAGRARPRVADSWAGVDALLDRGWPSRRLARRDGQLPDLLDRLAAAMRAGRSLGPALSGLVDATPDPLRDDLVPVRTALDRGVPLSTALRAWGNGADASAEVRLVAAALALGASAGGQVARAIDRTAATLRERRALQREVHSLATQARASAVVLVLAPLAFTALIATVEPAAVRFLVTSPAGILCVVAGLGLDGIGAAWMARIVRRAA